MGFDMFLPFMPFCNATALEGDPLELVATVFQYRKENNMTSERYIHRKKETIQTKLTYFEGLVVVNLPMMNHFQVKAHVNL